VEGHVVILLFCTDRGRHNRVDLWTLDTAGCGPGQVRVATAGGFGRRSEAERRAGGMVMDRVELPCRKCSHRPAWPGHRARAIHDGAVAGGMGELDLSYLD
jgi:hypothetical protein